MLLEAPKGQVGAGVHTLATCLPSHPWVKVPYTYTLMTEKAQVRDWLHPCNVCECRLALPSKRRGYKCGFGAHTWVQTPARLCPICGNLGKLRYPPEPQFLHL